MALRAKDIAQMLGVSTATVSLVLNNKPGVGEQKRREIIEKIRELGCEYMLKEAPARGNKGRIGFVIYKKVGQIVDESPFFTYILEGMNRSINSYGYTLNFLYLNHDTPLEQKIGQLKGAECEGFVIFAVEMNREDLQVFVDFGLPFCVLDNSFQESDVDCVAINNAQGTSKAVQHLYDMGHREIGYIRCRIRINSFEERYQEYVKWMGHLGLTARREYIIDVGYSEGEIKEGIRAYFQGRERFPTAFMAENDFLACNAMKEIQELGYRIPEDLSVVGFDDRPIAQMVYPNLTTVNVPKDIFGPAAVELLMSKIQKGRTQSLKLDVGTNLVARESVKKIR